MKLKLDANGNAVLQDGAPVYVKEDGTEIAFDGAKAFAKIGQLTGENTAHRKRYEEAESKLKAFDGIADPAAALKALATVKNLDDKKLVDAGEVEKVKAEVQKALEQQYAPFKAKAEALEAQLNQHLIGGLFSSSKFIAEKFAAQGPAGVEIARALFANRFKVEDGKVVAYDGAGNKLFSRVNPGDLADGDEAIQLLVEAYPHKDSILRGTGASGSGAGQHGNGGNGGQRSLTRAQFEALGPAERVAALKTASIID